MRLDALTQVSTDQQVTANAYSENSVDVGAAGMPVGDGEPIGFAVTISAIGTTTGSVKLEAVESDAATLDSNTAIIGEVDLLTAGIAAGKTYFVPITPGKPVLRYIGLYVAVTGTVDFTCDIALMPQSMYGGKPKNYASGYTA